MVAEIDQAVRKTSVRSGAIFTPSAVVTGTTRGETTYLVIESRLADHFSLHALLDFALQLSLADRRSPIARLKVCGSGGGDGVVLQCNRRESGQGLCASRFRHPVSSRRQA